MTINLRKKLLRLHTTRRRKRAAGLLMEAVARFSKSDPDKIRLDKGLNEFILKKASGASFLWAKLKVNVEKSADKVEVKMYSQKTQAQTSQQTAKADEKKQATKEAKEPKPQKQV
ncbi:MAG: hypothetical protein KGH57_04110 [Candidatus Micrarchaeota archaeon]|nr:hypothetical protein [Candidatus Micrarchaeota archaeon]